MIEWTDSLSVNVPSMDEEHRKLISLINDLYEYLHSGDNKKGKSLSDIIHGITDYAEIHLKNEEQLLRKAGFPDYMNHKHTHDEFRKKVIEFNRAFDSSTGDDTVHEILFYLQNWLVNHIKIQDRKYSPFLGVSAG